MVLGIFKSKEQRNKEKLKKEIKGKISTIGQGGGRSKQGTKKRLQRELANVDKPKKKEKKVVESSLSGAQANKRKNYGNNQTNTSSKSKTSTKVKGRKLSPYEMKKEARLQAMRDRARKKHEAWKKERGRK